MSSKLHLVAVLNVDICGSLRQLYLLCQKNELTCPFMSHLAAEAEPVKLKEFNPAQL